MVNGDTIISKIQKDIKAIQMKRRNKKPSKDKHVLVGYRHPSIKIDNNKTKLKPLGYVVGTAGFVSLAIALFPNGLSFIFYPISAFLFGLIGVDIYKIMRQQKKKLFSKIRMFKYKRGWL